jgi:hypothetical protein
MREAEAASAMRKTSKTLLCLMGLIAASFAAPTPAWAGPPFVTDDPVPVDLGHWEVYGFSTATQTRGDFGGTLGAVEVNYGAAPNLQLHIMVPLAFDTRRGGSTQVGVGDVELGAKVRLVDPGPDDWWPQIAIFPALEVPSGNAQRGLGGGATRAYFPLWLQKDFGRWTTYGGGGFWINPGSGNRDYWFAGWLLQYQIADNFALGGELFHQTPDAVGGTDATGFNLGGIFDFTEHYHLLVSAGRGLQNAPDSNEFSYYLAIQWTG